MEMLHKMVEREDELLEVVELRNTVKKWMQQDRDLHLKTPSAASTPTAGSSPIALPSSSALPSVGDDSRKRSGEPCDITKKKAKTRSTSAVTACKERDDGCIMSRATPSICEVAHLYPFSMIDPSSTGARLFWRTLQLSWTEEQVNHWWRAVYGDNDGTEKPENLITLSTNARKMHSQGYFSLEPVTLDPDRKKLTLCFWWSKQGQSAEEMSVSDVPGLTATYGPQGDHLDFWNMHTYQALRSGDLIVLTTPDPNTHPLPDIRIIEMQWVMNRITAMRGAAEPKDPFDSDSEDKIAVGAVFYRDLD